MGVACCAPNEFVRQNSPFKASKICVSPDRKLIDKVKMAIKQCEQEKQRPVYFVEVYKKLLEMPRKLDEKPIKITVGVLRDLY